mmetsp:Transcript_6373/g.11973  ORF Transcript_6373/g.11973 Transcript_6373/m.11973 type:complete len:207 (-) Transcript_6373:363-983(-)
MIATVPAPNECPVRVTLYPSKDSLANNSSCCMSSALADLENPLWAVSFSDIDSLAHILLCFHSSSSESKCMSVTASAMLFVPRTHNTALRVSSFTITKWLGDMLRASLWRCTTRHLPCLIAFCLSPWCASLPTLSTNSSTSLDVPIFSMSRATASLPASLGGMLVSKSTKAFSSCSCESLASYESKVNLAIQSRSSNTRLSLTGGW